MSSTMAKKKAPSVMFSSLPKDMVLNVVARVPKRFYPILSCVSKSLRSLVRSFELQKTRSLLRKEDRFCVCLNEYVTPYNQKKEYNGNTSSTCFYDDSLTTHSYWYILTKDRRLVSVPFPSPPETYSSALTVGPDIYFVGSHYRRPSKRMWILDSRSGKLREGPRAVVASHSEGVGLVNDKIYVFGGESPKKYQDIQAQVFDLKTQTWQIAPNPSIEMPRIFEDAVTSSIDRKIYARYGKSVIAYDTKDGICDKIITAEDFCSRCMGVVDNIRYMHYPYVGLMWYKSKEKEWRVVSGVKLNGYFGDVVMAEYNGKLAFVWKLDYGSKVWCVMISLYGSEAAIRGEVEWCDCLLSDVPHNYGLRHVLVCSD